MITEMVLVQKVISKVFGDFVAKAVSDSVDVLKDAIKDADLDRKSYNQNLQTRLYQLIVDALNRFTYNKYKKQDKLYAAAESILKGYISTQDDIDVVKLGLKMLVLDVNNDTCQEFLETLCGEICRDDNSDLYKEFDMLWKRQESEYFRGEFAKIDQNDREILEQLNDLKEVLEFIKRNMSRQEGDKLGHNGFPIVNRADEYGKKWDKNVFLNDFNIRDKNAGVNIKLKELYLEEHLPHYVWKMNDEPLDDLKELLCEYTVDNDDKKMLLILGQAGIGKSTLITWIMANLVEKKDDIYVYQFSSDLGAVNWQSNNILDEIFSTIGIKYNELEGRLLILDGFDEINVKEDRERILHKLNQELEKGNFLKTFSIIITCRENYVDKLKLERIEYITLQAWDEVQMKSFCEIYEEVIIRKDLGLRINKNLEIRINKIIEKKDIMGIPLILYMVLALDVDIERSSSAVDIYDQIFSFKRGGIYDRGYDVEHRISISENKKHIHRISQQIAFWMFENSAEKATITQEKFEEICDNEMDKLGKRDEGIKSDVLIGNFFRLRHCEGKGTDELQFVHRSIYEYFVVIYFFESTCNLTSKEKIAGKLGELLKDGHLSKQILEFIKYKFDSIKGYDLSDVTREVFNIMLRDGMIFYAKGKHKKIIVREMNIFTNMLEVVRLWNYKLGKLDNKIVAYLQHNHLTKLNLRGICLKEADLRGVDLRAADLKGADLRGADLREADLRRTDLRVADLEKTNLRKANLEGADLSVANLKGADLGGGYLCRADLRGANLSGTNLRGADLDEAALTVSDLNIIDFEGIIINEDQVRLLSKYYELCGSRVHIFDTGEIINYEEYCSRQSENEP